MNLRKARILAGNAAVAAAIAISDNRQEDIVSVNRRQALLASIALLGAGAFRSQVTHAATARRFPKGFIWGAATAGHQVEGNDTNSDEWFLQQLKPTLFAERAGDADNSFVLWQTDLDVARSLNLNAYRFSLEWSRIEPDPGQFSVAMLDHYLRIIDGCHLRGLQPLVTFNHFATPRWFAAAGGWTSPQSPVMFERFCDRAARHLARPIGRATTLNEPNLLRLLAWLNLPQAMLDGQRSMLDAAARALGVQKFTGANAANPEDVDAIQANLLEGHRRGRLAIKSVRPDLPVGVSLAIEDDQAVGEHSRRDQKRAQAYQGWLEAVKGDDFVGVQNYARALIDEHGTQPPAQGAPLDGMGREIYPPSLVNAVRYVHEQTARPILITEHGLCTDDDRQRAAFIRAALAQLADAVAGGLPVLGYVHWSLLDNFEWIFGYKPHYGLCAVDRQTFKRTPKPSAAVLAAIARHNEVPSQ
jgi:beta-glucosidase